MQFLVHLEIFLLVETYYIHEKAVQKYTWWRHQMERFSALLALCAGNSAVTDKFPAQRPVTRSFDGWLICAWINGWVNNRETGDLRRNRGHYDVTIMKPTHHFSTALPIMSYPTFIKFIRNSLNLLQISFISEVSDPSPSLNSFWFRLFLFFIYNSFYNRPNFFRIVFIFWDEIIVTFLFCIF